MSRLNLRIRLSYACTQPISPLITGLRPIAPSIPLPFTPRFYQTASRGDERQGILEKSKLIVSHRNARKCRRRKVRTDKVLAAGASSSPQPATGSLICFLLSAKRDAAAARALSRQSAGPERTIRRRELSTPISTPVIRRPSCSFKAESALEKNCGHRPVQYLEQRPEAGSPGDQATGPRESTFPLLLECVAHLGRLRSNPYNAQRLSVRKCVVGLAFCCSASFLVCSRHCQSSTQTFASPEQGPPQCDLRTGSEPRIVSCAARPTSLPCSYQ